MSRLYGVFDAFNAVDTLEVLIKSCEETMNYAEKTLKTDKDSNELIAIYESAKQDKELLQDYYKRQKEDFDKLLEMAKNDKGFMDELEITTVVPEEYKKALTTLKSQLSQPQGYEKSEK